MLEAWARAYADRWGLPGAAVEELQGVIDAVRKGEVSDPRADTRPFPGEEPSGPSTSPPPRIPDALGRKALWDAGDRYEDMGPIGEGGMGEVRRVWDASLQRAVAMKVLRRDLASRDDLVHRFIEEAQATGQLEHPGIVPVYDFGKLPDGRPYFTMKEIRGRSLLDVIEEVHAESDEGWGVTPSGWTFHRLIGVLQQVCEAMAYAHSRGVLHRDMKPTNVMVGAFGEVVVMDWGLAKVAAAAGLDSGHRSRGTGQVVTARSRGALYVTRSGSVAGTPNYMPPEQARGDHGLIGPWSDVYALGALLYEILADRAPYEGDDLDDVVAQVLAAPPPTPYPRWQARHGDEPYPEDALRAICAKAMAREIADRYMDASTLGEAISEWLDSAGARDRALQLVRRADAIEPDLVALRKRAATLRAQAAGLLATLPGEASPDQKRAGWALEDEAMALDAELQRKQTRYTNLLQAAFAGVPDLPEAAARLEALGDLGGPFGTAAALEGDGWLTLTSEPSNARVTLRRIEPVDRRLVAVHAKEIDVPIRTPVDRLKLRAGGWQLRIDAEGCDPLTVLAQVRPGELWSTAPAGTTRPVPMRPARAGADPVDTVRVPAGWFWCGGDVELADSLPRSKVWVDAFLVQVHPVTTDAFVRFLNALAEAGGGSEAERLAPAGVRRDAEGAFQLPADWEAAQPVRRVTFDAARAYAAWLTVTTGRSWRLPREREWEKAARGVDERQYPWGNFLDPAWCCVADSHRGKAPHPATIHEFPLDASPYGVRGLGGNVRDWVIDDRAPRGGDVAGEHRIVKGGHWLGIAQFARCALRYRLPVGADDTVGFRLVSTLEGG